MKHLFRFAVIYQTVMVVYAIIDKKPAEALIVYCTCLLLSVIGLVGYKIIEEIKKCK